MMSGRCMNKGISLVEMLVVVAVVGILGAIASGHFGQVVERSRETVARNVLEVLNQGVSRYSQVEGDGLRLVGANDLTSQEEVDILRALQWIDPVQPAPGGAYVRRDYNPGVSASTKDYRAIWNGAYFELRKPGERGAGLVIVFDSSDLNQTVEFPDGYVPLQGYTAELSE